MKNTNPSNIIDSIKQFKGIAENLRNRREALVNELQEIDTALTSLGELVPSKKRGPKGPRKPKVAVEQTAQ